MTCTLATPCSPVYVETHRAGWVTVVRERCTLGDHTLRTAVVGEAREERAVDWFGRSSPRKLTGTCADCGNPCSRNASRCAKCNAVTLAPAMRAVAKAWQARRRAAGGGG